MLLAALLLSADLILLFLSMVLRDNEVEDPATPVQHFSSNVIKGTMHNKVCSEIHGNHGETCSGEMQPVGIIHCSNDFYLPASEQNNARPPSKTKESGEFQVAENKDQALC